ncbi:hypothetical protein OC834_003941 [Tilletia horrida]|nr:hypothetical protein OC834_003941 [Tilletia horrida]
MAAHASTAGSAVAALRLALEPAALPKSAQQQQQQQDETDPFAPRLRLDDILPGNVSRFAAPHELEPSLTARLHRLWHERGDFSKFKRASLKPAATAGSTQDTDAVDPAEALFGIPSPPPADGYDGDDKDKPKNERNPQTDSRTSHVTVSTQDAETLKMDMLTRIGNAHFATYFLHNLVALLLQHQTAQRKLEAEQQSALSQAQVQIISTNNSKNGTKQQQQQQQQQRAGTPMTDISDTAAAAAAAAAQHAEPYFDPKILGLSEVQQDPVSIGTGAQDNLDEDEDADDDEAAKASDQTNNATANSLADASIPIDQTPLSALASQRATFSRTASILRAGASSIRRVAGSAPATSLSGNNNAEASSSSSSSSSSALASEARRWAGLQHLRLSGPHASMWTLAPAPQNVGAGSAVWWGGISAREDGEGAGAKDAWVGYGLPEVNPRLRRGAIAFFQDDDLPPPPASSSSSASATQADFSSRPETDSLIFLQRPKRRLRVRLISPKGEEALSRHGARRRTGRLRDGSQSQGGQLLEGIEETLVRAQEELLDEELWSDLLNQVKNTSAVVVKRAPAPASGASARAAAAAVALPKLESIEVKLGGGWRLVLEMGVPSDNEKSEEDTVSTATSPEGASAALPEILLAYLRLSLFRALRLRLHRQAVAAAAAAASEGKASSTASGTANKGKSQAQLEREAAAASSKRGVGAYELVSGSKLRSSAATPVPGAGAGGSGADKAGGVGKTKKAGSGEGEAEGGGRKESYLDPVLALFRYATFIADVERMLDALSANDAAPSPRRIWYSLSPLASLHDTTAWLRTLLGDGDGTPASASAEPAASSASAPTHNAAQQQQQATSTAAAGAAQQMDAVRTLSGVGTLFCGENPVILLRYGYPSRLSLSFLRREMAAWTGDLTLHAAQDLVGRELRALAPASGMS